MAKRYIGNTTLENTGTQVAIHRVLQTASNSPYASDIWLQDLR